MGTQKNRKVKMLTAKKYQNMNNNKFIIILSIKLILFGCSSIEKKIIPTYNKGGYSINIIEMNSNNDLTDIYIYGQVFDIKNEKPLSNVQLTFGCYKFKTLSSGKYSFKVKHQNESVSCIKAISIGYKTVETDFINFNKNSININFFLTEDDRPFIHCGGVK